MTKTLYEEAVADAKALRQLAEETAKNKIVEAVMPQIRSMVNQRIMGEDIDLENLEIPDETLDFSEPMSDDDDLELTADTLASTVINVDASGDVNFEIEGSESEEDDLDDPIITGSMSEALLNILGSHEVNSNKSKAFNILLIFFL